MVRQAAGQGIAGLPQAQAATTAGLGRALQGMGYQAGQFDSAAAQQYMSPYMQQVVDVQKQRAIQDFNQQNANRAAQAVQAGAFGGSRQAVAQAMAGQELSQQLADIQATGQQKAFEQAQAQFERDRAARADAERLGLGAAELTASQGAQLANLGRMAREGMLKPPDFLRGLVKTFKHATKLVWILPMKILYVSGITPENSYSSIHPYLEVSLFNRLQRQPSFNSTTLSRMHWELVLQDWVCIGASWDEHY